MSSLNREDTGFLAFIRRRDALAQPISLTYNRKKKHPSACGGCLSMGMIIFMIVYVSLLITKVAE